MKKLFLLLIPLLFTSCVFEELKRGDFTIFNETQADSLLIVLSCDKNSTSKKYTLYSSLECTNHLIDCDYTLKVKNKKRPNDDWTTFIFHPAYSYRQYYIIGTDSKFIMTSSVVKGKSENIKRIPPSTE